MERSIDRLADLARNNVEPSHFFSEVLESAIQAGGASRAFLWRPSVEGAWELVVAAPAKPDQSPALTEQRQELLSQISQGDKPHQLNLDPGSGHSDLNRSVSESSHVLSPIRHAEQTVGILETTHDIDSAGQLPADTIRFFTALCEITADFLAQNELQQLRRARTTWQQWDQFSLRLWQSPELSSVAAAIANDGRLMVECDRISVLIRRGSSFQLKSLSGIERVEPRSSATRSLEALARLVARQGEAIWCDEAKLTQLEADRDNLNSPLQRHFRDSGAKGIGIIPLMANRDEKSRRPPIAVIVVEQFKDVKDFSGWRSRGETLVNRSAATLRAAFERSEIPWLGLWIGIQRFPRLLIRPTTLLALALLTGIVVALIVIPAEFTVTGSAELWPARRREVFANASGIVDEILVSHGDDVSKDQPLIVLRDMELETDTPRILGEIATVNERLKGVQAARFVGGNTLDAVSRARQLTADEEELKERLRTLERQRLLIEERHTALTLRSPIAGKVLTWDVAQFLSARPVERGQSLLTIGETAGPWIVEVRIADKDAGSLLRARKSLSPDLDVDFLVASEPGRVYRGKIQDVSLSSEADDALHSHVRVVVAIDREQMEQPRAGATAIPRIRCGRKPLGYVWLHEFIDAIRTRLLF